jgi:hypothetical protein
MPQTEFAAGLHEISNEFQLHAAVLVPLYIHRYALRPHSPNYSQKGAVSLGPCRLNIHGRHIDRSHPWAVVVFRHFVSKESNCGIHPAGHGPCRIDDASDAFTVKYAGLRNQGEPAVRPFRFECELRIKLVDCYAKIPCYPLRISFCYRYGVGQSAASAASMTLEARLDLQGLYKFGKRSAREL